MGDIPIQRISVTDSGLIAVKVRPLKFPDYSLIWRSATSVRWNAEGGELYAIEIEGFSPVDYLKLIATAVQSEYGERLVIGNETDLTGVPEQLAAKLRQALSS